MQTAASQSGSVPVDRRPGVLDRDRTGKPAGERPLLYEVTGQGEPIVLMPGGLTGWSSGIPHAERLAERHRVIRAQLRSVELAEAGQPLPPSYSALTERDALLAMVDELGVERFDLTGWSAGGGAALAFSLDYPQRVRTLTLIEPPVFWLLRQIGYPMDTVAEDERIDRELASREITIDDLKMFLVRAGLGDVNTDFESHPRWPIMVRNRQALAASATEWDYTDSLDRLRALDIPILAVKGTETAEFLAAGVDAIAAIAPKATVLELPGGHACHIEHPDRYLEALEAHLAGEPII
jgi:pimeloyl-ACP methyl ester carboxylesterase